MSGFNCGRRKSTCFVGMAWLGILGLSVALMGLQCPVPPEPLEPAVDAGADQTADGGDTVTLTAVAENFTGEVSFAWAQTAGGSAGTATLSGAATDTLSVTFSDDAAGTFTYEVTASDDDGNEATDSVSVVVTPQPPPPPAMTVNAGADTTVTGGGAVTLTAQRQNGVSPIIFAWELIASGSAGSVAIAPADGLAQSIVATFSLDAEGTFTFQVTATDAVGETAVDSVNVVATPSVVPPSFEFTTATDNLTGTDGDDLFTAFLAAGGLQTLNTGDSANGMGGNDRLIAFMKENARPNLSNIEDIEITVVDANSTLNASNTTGADTISSVDSEFDLTVSNLGALVNAALINPDPGVNLTFNFTASTVAGTDDAIGLSLSGVEGGSVFTADGIETLAVDTGDSEPSEIELAMADLVDMTVEGDQALDLTVAALPATLESLDASAMTGGGVQADAPNTDFAFTGGAGDDRVNFAAGQFDDNDSAEGGDGEDTLGLASADAEAVTAAGDELENVSGFELLAITDAIAGDIDITLFNLSSTLVAEAGVDTTGGAVSITLASGDNVIIEADNAGANDLTFEVGGSGISDSMSLTLDDADIATHTVVFDGIEIVNIESTGDANTVDTIEITPTDPAGPAIGNAVVNVTGDEDLTIATTIDNTINSALTLDASAFTGALTVAAAADAITIIGGSGDDNLTGSGSGDAIDGGEGDDIIDGGAGADSLTGGPGNDTFLVSNAGDENGDEITDFGDGDDVVDYDGNYLGGASVEVFSDGTTVAALAAGDDNTIVLLSEAQTTAELAANGAAINAIVVAFDSTKGHMVIVADDDWSDGANRTIINVINITSLAEVTALEDGAVIN